MKGKHQPKRSPDQTTATYSIPAEMKNEISKIASEEYTNTSSIVRQIIGKFLDERKNKKGVA